MRENKLIILLMNSWSSNLIQAPFGACIFMDSFGEEVTDKNFWNYKEKGKGKKSFLTNK